MSADGGPFGDRASWGDGAPTPEELAAYPLNDFGNAMRFIRQTGGTVGPTWEVDTRASRVLYLRARGWIAFNGRFWDLERGEGLARRAAAQVGHGMMAQAAIRVEAMEDASAKAKQAVWDFANQAGNNGRLTALLNVAADYLEVGVEDFDKDPMALNVENGLVRFRMGPDGPVAQFRHGHEPGDRMTRICAGPYEAGTPAPLFEMVVAEAQPRPEDRDYLHRVLGYCATGSTEEQKFFVLQGKGGDGKSTIVNACRHALGTYATTVAVETFLDTGVKRGSEASPDIAALAGDTRMLSAGEPPSGSKLATGAIKTFTGGGSMKARELREKLFEFEPIGKPIIECNRRPAINDTDDGIWRRLKTIPFPHQMPADRIDPTLPKKLKGEAAGIIAWLVEGVLAWMAKGLRDEPESVREAVEDYRKGSNPFAQWLDARVILDAQARVRASLLYTDYKTWCDENGHERPMSQRAFGSALGDLQIMFAGKDGDGKVTRRGARLRLLSDGEAAARASDTGQGAGGLEGSDDDEGPLG